MPTFKVSIRLGYAQNTEETSINMVPSIGILTRNYRKESVTVIKKKFIG